MSLKGFGLVLPKKEAAKAPPVSRSAAVKSVFRDDSDDDDDEIDGRKQVNLALQLQAEKAKNKKKVQRDMEAALEQDATVYQYDEVYDEMAAERQRADPRFERLNAGGGEKRKSKYIDSLMKAATDRKKLEDVRLAHKLQRERENEDEEFAGKEEFVTSAYRKKLEEVRQQEERDRQQEALEARNDVTKKGDLSGFYRNLLTGNTAMGAAEKPIKVAATLTSAPTAVSTAVTPPRDISPLPAAAAVPLAGDAPLAAADVDHGDVQQGPSNDEAVSGGLDTRRFDERRRRAQAVEAAERAEAAARQQMRSESRSPTLRPGRDGDDSRRGGGRDRDGRVGVSSAEERSRSPPRKAPAEPAVSGQLEEEAATKFGRRATDESIQSARERYLARKRERHNKPKPVID